MDNNKPMHFADREYYEIKTPMVSKYTDRKFKNINMKDNDSGFKEMQQFLKQSLKYSFYSDKKSADNMMKKMIKYLSLSKKHIEGMDYLHRRIKLYKTEEYNHYYISYVIFISGLITKLEKSNLLGKESSYGERVSKESALLYLEAFLKDMNLKSVLGEKTIYERYDIYHNEFENTVPWPFFFGAASMDNLLSREHLYNIEKYSIKLFSDMVDVSLFTLSICKDKKYRKEVKDIILSYYKYLKKHNMLMPKYIQRKIYRTFCDNK